MQNIEEQALATYKWTLLFWLRYVDDTLRLLYTLRGGSLTRPSDVVHPV